MRHILIILLLLVAGCSTTETIPIDGVSLEYPQKVYRFSFKTPQVLREGEKQLAVVDGVVRGSEDEIKRNSSRGSLFYQRITTHHFLAEVIDNKGVVTESGNITISRYRIVGSKEAECKLQYRIETPLQRGYRVRFSSLKEW